MKDWYPFVVRETPTEQIVALLKSVTLGTNGAKYRHLNTEERLKQLYHPIYLTLERNGRALANITCCRRPFCWYVRYFAFDELFQVSNHNHMKASKGQGGLKKKISAFFESAERGELGPPPSFFYAYIDPRNERSLLLSKGFGFKTVRKIATQTFSRTNPGSSDALKRLDNKEYIKSLCREHFGDLPLFFDFHTLNSSPFYGLFKAGKLVAFAKVHRADWVIEQLPGRNGKMLTKMVPYIPRLRKVLKPKSHQFLVLDSVWSEVGNPQYLEELFSGLLYEEGRNLAIWWVDKQDQLYTAVQNKIKWGILHRINGAHEVDLVVRSPHPVEFKTNTYVTGIDFV